MSKETIEKIKDAEYRARQIRTEASQKAKNMIENANAMKAEMLRDNEKEVLKNTGALISQANERAAEIKEENSKESEKLAQDMINGAKGKIDSAAEFIFKRVTEQWQ